MTRSLSLLLLLAIWTVPVAGQAPPVPSDGPSDEPPAQVLVLGVFHMANPGNDVANTEVDDVLSADRQREMDELVDVLARFRPTAIAVEADFSQTVTQERYHAYLAGAHALSRSETEQIGYRLGRRLALETIHPVDVSEEFPLPRLQDYAVAHDREAELATLMERLGREVDEQTAYLAEHTIVETLVRMNDPERVARDVAFYYRHVGFGEPWNWAGADLLAAWFTRNIRIHSNIRDLVEAGEERILVIYGAGHLGWLRANVRRDPTMELQTLDNLLHR